jgi:hypothetical protein
MLAPEIIDNGALSVLSLKGNRLATKEAGKALAAALAQNSVLTELDVSGNNWWASPSDKGDGVGFAQELSVGLRDNGAMTSLNLASNRLYAKGAKIVAEAIKVTKCTPAIILVPFSCPSEFSINCCCLLLSPGYGGVDCVEFGRQ